MLLNKIKIFALFSILCLFIVIPTSFAMDNDTVIVGGDTTSHDYYFDASVENDSGDGSQENPYKTLTSGRIKGDSIIHLANGRYVLDRVSYVNNVTIIGSDPENTIITYPTVGFQLKGTFTLNNVTLLYTGIKNNGYNLTANNAIFKGFSSSSLSMITAVKNSINNFNNCTFTDNSGNSGGAININECYLYIKDSQFINCNANNYGGAISCEDNAHMEIYDSKFINDNSKGFDGGGAIFLLNSVLKTNGVGISNCSASFGGAITSLSSQLNLTNFISRNNKAKYYGGSVYSLYDTFYIFNSTLVNNSAENGGALYAEGVEIFRICDNRFINNTATVGGAVYSVISDFFYDSLYDSALNNSFVNNDAYSSDELNITFENDQYILIKYNPSFNGTLPDKYDLRDLGQVSPVKDQGSGGNCWAFSSIAALESAILKAMNTTYDLSEENMKNLISMYSSYGWAMETNTGGYDRMAIGYLTGWLGPVNETDNLYNPKSRLSPLLTSFIHVQNIVFFKRDNLTDNNAIKKAIMDYGAVSASIKWTGVHVKGNNRYYDGTPDADHSVAIVGWDDNYSRSNFAYTKGNSTVMPDGDGAWIIKNSHGVGSGDGGYWYISYYDTGFAEPGKYCSYAFILNDSIKYDKNYQYDVQGRTDFFYNTTSTVWYKNKFTATSDEYLAAVSTYFAKDTSWVLSVYVNNALKLTKSGKSPGSYSTIGLGELITLKEGDVFEVVFKITVDGDAGVPISESISLNEETYREDISFISYDGKNWADLYELVWEYPNHTYDSQVACIKAFTIFDKINTSLSLDVSDPVNPAEITATVRDSYGNLVESGVVIFNVEGKNVKSNVKNGVAKINYLFKNPTGNVVKATFNANGYVSSSSSINATVKRVYLNAENLVSYYTDAINYRVSLIDSSSNPVGGKEIRFNVNNKNYVEKTDSKGIASIDLNLNIGIYNVTVGLNYDTNHYLDLVRTITVKSTISLPEVTKYTLNSNYQATLYDHNGIPLKNKDASVIVDSTAYDLTTDSEGRINFNVNLASGLYTIYVVNNVTGDVKSQDITVVDRLNSNKDITMYYGAGTTYKVRAYDDNGNIAKGVKVVINLNGKNYYKYTNDSGYAYLTINLAPNTYTITATYKGFKVSNKVVVKPTLVMYDKTVKRSKTFSYTVKLLNSKGSILKSKVVKVKFKGKTYSAKTNSKGIATYKIKVNSAIGKYALTATYGNAKITKTITVKK